MTWIGAAVAAVLFIGGLTASAPGVALLGLCAGLVVLFVGAFMARTAYPTKMDDGYCWLKVGQPFLESIAESDDD